MRSNYFVIALLLLGLQTVYGQCPADITTNSAPVTVDATCPSSGQVTIHSNVEALSTATYQIISATKTGTSVPLEGYQTTSQSSNSFTSLPAGDYTVRISCGTVFEDVTFKIKDLYTPLTLTPSVSSVCAAGSVGGKITASATGGKPTLTYGFLQSTSATEPDANFAYSASNEFTAPAFGTYQVRVKDGCNNFTTVSVDVQPSSPKAKFQLQYESFTCDKTTYTSNRLLRLSDGSQINATGSGYVVEMWYISSTASCTVPSGTPDKKITVNANADISSLGFPSTTKRVLIRTTSPCGEENIECVDIKHPELTSYGTVHVGCPDGSDVNIAVNAYNGVSFINSSSEEYYKVDVQGYDAGNNPVAGTKLTDYHYLFGNSIPVHYADHYTYTVKDSCGDILTKTLVTPKLSTAPYVSYIGYARNCVTTVGTIDLEVQVWGYVPDQDFSSIKLFRASDHSFVANASGYNPSNGSVSFKAIPPGAYIIQFTPTDPYCGVITEVSFSTDSDQEGLTLGLKGNTSQLCGGNGTISPTLSYNGTRPVSYQLLQGTTVLATNSSGNFPNLAAGTYKLQAIVNMSSCGVPDIKIKSQDLMITPADSHPVVVKKLGINCESTVATGKAVFEFAGFGPFALEMKKKTESNYTLINASVPNNYTAEGLEASTDYDVRITDKCGKTEVTQVSIKPLIAVLVTNTAQPCLDQPYTLSVEEITNATYEWEFNGTPLAGVHGKDIVFTTYTAANNGVYQCTIKLDECITRITTVSLNSINCNQPLTKSGLGDFVWNDDNMDGIQDAGELGQSGITVTLYESDSTTVMDVTTTDADGYYSFSNLSAGSYYVVFSDLPGNYGFSPNVGALSVKNNSDADKTGKTGKIVLADNAFNLNIDAGIYNTLPVTLISFTAKAIEKTVQLSWSTSMETNSDRFEIENSFDGKSWKKIGVVLASKESNSVKAYHYTDNNPMPGSDLYRLRMVDADMSSAYSRIRQVLVGSGENDAVLFPNPATERLFLASGFISTVSEVTITDNNGRVVYTANAFPVGGINVKKLSSGTHSVSIKQKDGTVLSNRMLIIK